eukprot:TRINITY_DN1417_c0_g1_i3.p1 TRINITY_DN1417_c0_g1~~TRINITY_DN1417_c0_g1_i3.p1  ORF type:complete len:271 (-),score=14.52 TRINITY_DN1417_c0_g1_i3:248-1060(-)
MTSITINDISPLTLSKLTVNPNDTLDLPSPQNVPSSEKINFTQLLSPDYTSSDSRMENGTGSTMSLSDQLQGNQNENNIQITEILYFDTQMENVTTPQISQLDENISSPITSLRQDYLIEVDQLSQQLEIFEPQTEELEEIVEVNELVVKIIDEDQQKREEEPLMRKFLLREPSIQKMCLVDQKQEDVGQIIKVISVADTGGCCRACLKHQRCNAYLYCSRPQGCITLDNWMIFHTQCLLQLITLNQDLESVSKPLPLSYSGLVSGRILN